MLKLLYCFVLIFFSDVIVVAAVAVKGFSENRAQLSERRFHEVAKILFVDGVLGHAM